MRPHRSMPACTSLVRILGVTLSIIASAAMTAGAASGPQDPAVAKRLAGFDDWMKKAVEDWNVPGIGVAIVVGDRVVLAQGWGYRDPGQKLPFTARTTQPIASNTKLFTAVAAGMLVQEGKLSWDEPIRQSVPSIRFYNEHLDATVTLRDMLAHRTGITRHDLIWYKSDFTRRELFKRLRYLEPKESVRQLFLYNNMMYSADATYGCQLPIRGINPFEEVSLSRHFPEEGKASGRVPFSNANCAFLKAMWLAVKFDEQLPSWEDYLWYHLLQEGICFFIHCQGRCIPYPPFFIKKDGTAHF